MPQSLATVLSVFIGLHFVAIAASSYQFYLERRLIQKKLLLFWIASLLNLLIQFIFQHPLAAVYSMGLSIVYILVMLDVVGFATDQKVPLKKYIAFQSCMYPLAGILYFLKTPFYVFSMPVAIGVALPAIHFPLFIAGCPRNKGVFFFLSLPIAGLTLFFMEVSRVISFSIIGGLIALGFISYILLKPSKGYVHEKFVNHAVTEAHVRVMCYISVLLGLHYLDFPFLRPLPTAAVAGFSIMLALVLSIALITPTFFLLDEVNKKSKKILKSEKEKTLLLGHLSHDLATPLSALNFSFHNLLVQPEFKEGIESEQGRKIINNMRNNLNVINNSIQMVDDARRADIGQLKVKPKCICFQDIQDELISNINSSTNYDDEGKISLESSDTDILFWADPYLLINNILPNLVRNALKFSSSSNEIMISFFSEPGEWVRLQVQDQGIGIPAKHMEKIFSEGGSGIIRRGVKGETGTGLGLMTCRAFVENMGGRIELQSKSAEDGFSHTGTTVTVFLKKA